jgi:hypothetical protein
MKKAVFIQLLICFSLVAQAQSKKQVREYKIKSVAETKITYDNGTENSRYVRERLGWDKKGKLILEERFQPNGDLVYRETYVYKGNQIVEETQEYPKKKRSVDKAEYLRTVNTYKGEDKIIEEDYDKSNNLIVKRVSIFNRFGDKIEEIEYSPKNEILSKTTYQYDKRGLKTEKLTCDAAGIPQVKITYEYTF